MIAEKKKVDLPVCELCKTGVSMPKSWHRTKIEGNASLATSLLKILKMPGDAKRKKKFI